MSHARLAVLSGLAVSVALLLVSVPAFANGRVLYFANGSDEL